MTNLSACLIVRDGAKTLGNCLASLTGWVSEVIVVIDPRTQDSSASIARQSGAKVLFRSFDNFSSQKNFCASQASHDWLLFVDADEFIPDLLQKEISSVIGRTSCNGFYIPRLNIIFGKKIMHSNWGPFDDSHIWLYKKNQGTWRGIVHEEVQISGPIGRLNNYKLHHSYSTVSEFIDKLNYYTSFSDQTSFSYRRLFWNPVRDFLRRYVWHHGFMDGYHGLFLAYLMAVYHLSEVIKLWRPKNLSSPLS